MRLNPEYRLKVVAGENMLLHIGRKTVNLASVFSLNDSAAWLWRKIGRQEFTEDILVGWILDEYEVDENIARSDVHDMLLLWHQYGMLLD